MARRLGSNCWLYVVTRAREASTAIVHPIRDPAARLRPEPRQQIVRYRVKRVEWKQAVEVHN